MRKETIHLLPRPQPEAYFPNAAPVNSQFQAWVDRRLSSGDSAIIYGSQVTGDSSPTSRHDVIFVVQNIRTFHQLNADAGDEKSYSRIRTPGVQAWLNRYGPNYHTTVSKGEDGRDLLIKFASISNDNFILGCGGTLAEREYAGEGNYGMYVAGRVQKVALNPAFNPQTREELEQAINMARIDGTWMALGLLGKQFTLDQLLNAYVNLSYKADLRVEKHGKSKIILQNSRDDYERMMLDILSQFSTAGIVEQVGDTEWRKAHSPSRGEVTRRLWVLKAKSAARNYGKNPITAGPVESIKYASEKVARAANAALQEGIVFMKERIS